MNPLADALAGELAQLKAATPWEVGTVDSVQGDGTVTVIVRSSSIPGLHHLAGYTPTAGDVVAMIAGGQQLLILDKIV